VVIKKLVFVAWAFLVALGITACTFKERTFKADLACESDADCDRPDQECRIGLCTQRACSSSNPCPAGHEMSCTTEGVCVVAECSGDSCSDGYACNEGFCQASFNVASAASASNTSISITFDSPPDAATATDIANYTVDGLALSGTPTLAGSTVTISTGPQAVTSYTVTVAGVLRDFDKAPLINTTATFTGRGPFNVVSATSASAMSVAITFSEAPDATTATNIANYSINNGLAVTGSAQLNGNVVTISTGTQGVMTYTVTVSNVVRAADNEALTNNAAMFSGRTDFNVLSVVSNSSTSITVTFDAPPNSTQATTLGNYTISGLNLSGTPVLAGNAVTITTAPQDSVNYTLVVSGLTRNADAEPLTVAMMDFMGRSPFIVSGAVSKATRQFSLTFSDPPDPAAAVVLANYSVNGLTLTGTPVLAGNTVTIDTAVNQAATTYTVTVNANVKRDSDMEPLSVNSYNFLGRAPFNVAAAIATSSTTVSVTFSDPPNSGQAVLAGNYMLTGGVSVLGASAPVNNTVTLTTTPMAGISYTLTVAGISRASDGEGLTTTTAVFMGRAPFNVLGATAATSSTIAVTFDGAPNSVAAQTIGNYTITGAGGLVVTGALLSGNTVTLTTTTPMMASTYTVTVTGVTRNSDGEALTVDAASFTGRTKFNVVSASSGSNVTVRVFFDAAPNSSQAMIAGNYTITGGSGLSVSNASLAGNMVTLTTSTQSSGANYTVTVSGVTRVGDNEPLTVAAANFTGLAGFNVVGATANNTTTVTVNFDAAPTAAAAGMASNYTVTGATVMAASYMAGNTYVTLTTSALADGAHTVTVAGGAGGVTKASDASVLVVTQAAFGYTAFNVLSATAITNKSASITFDAAPNATQAVVLANYTVNCSPMACTNITLSNPVLNGNTVTFTTTGQEGGKTYTITVANAVTRASDGALLANKVGTFTGRSSFNVTSATSLTSGTIQVVFDAAPTPAEATTLANYAISGNTLMLSGTPILSGNMVTLNTSVQMAVSYTVTVTGVTRSADGEPLSANMASFTGKAQAAPTVTNVQVQSTVPDNTFTFYNTGTATVVITGTEFNGVMCPNGVRLDDKDGNGAVLNTKPTSCTVNSATQITATFPAGIRSNYTGWNVQVTNSISTNTTSTVKLVVKAGLVISEVFVGSSASDLREFLEIYNVTATSINADNVSVHVRTSAGVENLLSLQFNGANCSGGVCTTTIPSHKHWLLASSQSGVATADSWWQYRDGYYDAGASSMAGQLTRDASVYISLSTTAQTKVLDKVGWGNATDNDAGRETTRLGNFGNDNKSASRKPNSTNPDTDSDVNSTDFFAPSTSSPAISPKGTGE